MAELKINTEKVMDLIRNVKNENNDISPSVQAVSSPSQCSGIMIQEYYSRIQKISELMKNYKELVKKDMDDIIKSEDTLKEMDKKIQNAIRQGPSASTAAATAK